MCMTKDSHADSHRELLVNEKKPGNSTFKRAKIWNNERRAHPSPRGHTARTRAKLSPAHFTDPQKCGQSSVCFGVACPVAGDWPTWAQRPLTDRALAAATLPAQSPGGLWPQFCLPLCSLYVFLLGRNVMFCFVSFKKLFSPFVSVRCFLRLNTRRAPTCQF